MRQTTQSLNSRRHRRYNVYLPVSLLKDDCTPEHILGEGDAFTLSDNGCQIFSEVGLETGAHLGLRLFLPGQEIPIHVGLAAVRWVRGQKSGLEFILVTGKERKRLEEFVAYLQRVAT